MKTAFVRTLPVSLVLTAALAGCMGGDKPEASVEKARTALAQKDRAAAEIHLRNALQKAPDNVEARLMMARVHADSGDHPSAAKEWQRALELGAPVDRALPGLVEALVLSGEAAKVFEHTGRNTPTQPQARADVMYWVGRAHAAARKPAEAEKSYRQALQDLPGHTRAQTGLLALQASAGDLAGALSGIDQVLERDPALYDALMLKARLQLSRNDRDGAKVSLRKAIAAMPASIEAHVESIALMTFERDFAGAEKLLADLRKVAPRAPIAFHLQAVLAFNQKNFDAAREANQQMLKAAPEFPPALAMATNLALMQRAFAQAEQHATAYMRLNPDSNEGRRLLATVHLAQNQPDKALQLLRPVAERGTRDAQLLATAGEAAMRSNDLRAAAAYFEAAAKLDPKDPNKRTGLALVKLGSGDQQAGLAELEAAAEQDPTGTRADMALIAARIQARQFDKALEAIERLAKKQPNSPIAPNLRGTVLQVKGDVAGARKNFEKSLELDPGYFAAVANLASLDVRENKIPDARARIERFIQKNPSNAQALMAMATINSRTGGKADDTLEYLRRARAADPTAIQATIALAGQLTQMGRGREAIPILQQAVEQRPEEIALLEALGGAYLLTNERQQALETFEKALRVNPKNPRLLMRIGSVRAQLGDANGAIASFRQAEQLEPRAVEPKYEIGSMLIRTGKHDEARKIAQSLQKDSPKNPAGLVLEGDVLAAERKWSESASAYRKSLAVQPSENTILKAHVALSRAGNAGEADKLLADAMKAAPKSLPLRLYSGDIALGRKDWKRAIELYDSVVVDQPDNALVLTPLAWALHQVKDARALPTAEKAFTIAPKSAQIADTLGQILIASGDKTRGLDTLRQAVTLAPQQPNFRIGYAEALARTGDKDGARRELEGVVRDNPGSPFARRARELADAL